MFYDESDLDELNAKIAAAEQQIDRVNAIGEEHSVDSGNGSRSTSEIDVASAQMRVNNLRRARREINGSCGGGSVMGGH